MPRPFPYSFASLTAAQEKPFGLDSWNPWKSEETTSSRISERLLDMSREMETKRAGSIYDELMEDEQRTLTSLNTNNNGKNMNLKSKFGVDAKMMKNSNSVGAAKNPRKVVNSGSLPRKKPRSTNSTESSSGSPDEQGSRANSTNSASLSEPTTTSSSENAYMDQQEGNWELGTGEQEGTGTSATSTGQTENTQGQGSATGSTGITTKEENEGSEDAEEGDEFAVVDDSDDGNLEDEEEEDTELTEDEDELQMEIVPEKKEKRKLPTGHLSKEGISIGCMNIFADVLKREYIVLLTDEILQAFITQPGVFRSVAFKAKCEIEISRRILVRRMSVFRWVKYMVIQIRGPDSTAIAQCDKLLKLNFPPYKNRKEYPNVAYVSLFIKEDVCDNTDLYFNFQRTGPCIAKVGELALNSPYGISKIRSLDMSPWKLGSKRLMRGDLEPRNSMMRTAVGHAYPEWGTETVDFVDRELRWEKAADIAIEIERAKEAERKKRMTMRKLCAEPLFVEEN